MESTEHGMDGKLRRGDRVRILNGVERGRVGTVDTVRDDIVRVVRIFDAWAFGEVLVAPWDVRREPDLAAEGTKTKIEVTVEDGMVTGVNNIPDDVVVEVRDYDIDGLTDEDIQKAPVDDDGQKFLLYVYPPEAGEDIDPEIGETGDGAA